MFQAVRVGLELVRRMKRDDGDMDLWATVFDLAALLLSGSGIYQKYKNRLIGFLVEGISWADLQSLLMKCLTS